MIKKIGAKKILTVLLALSLLVNLSYLADSKSKYLYLDNAISEIHSEFTRAIHTLYSNLYLIKDNGFGDKEYINAELEKAIGKISYHDIRMRRLGSLSDEYRYYNHYMDVYYYLNDLQEKEIFTEEDYQGIKEIYSLATSTGGITRGKYLFKLVPSEGFNNMSSKISEICRQTR